MEDTHIENMSEYEYNKYVKKQVRLAAFTELDGLRSGHSKVSQNSYTGIEKPQPYIRNQNITSRQSSLLFSLRSKTVRGVKSNWSFMGEENTLCPICERHEDTQSHVLSCPVMLSIKPKLKEHILYEHIDGNIEQQIQLVGEYEKYLELRDTLLHDDEEYPAGLPGLHTRPMLPKAAA